MAAFRGEPLLGLFRRLQQQGALRADVQAERLVRRFPLLNLGYLIARAALAAGHGWADEQEIAAIAKVFAAGAGPR